MTGVTNLIAEPGVPTLTMDRDGYLASGMESGMKESDHRLAADLGTMS